MSTVVRRKQVVVPVSDGEMTITQRYATSHSARVSPRNPLHASRAPCTRPGTKTSTTFLETKQARESWAGRPTGVSIVAFTNRIENDEGAWEGSAVYAELAGRNDLRGPRW